MTHVTPRWCVDSLKQFTKLMNAFPLQILSTLTLTLATICYCCRNAYGWDLDVYDILSPESQARHTVRNTFPLLLLICRQYCHRAYFRLRLEDVLPTPYLPLLHLSAYNPLHDTDLF